MNKLVKAFISLLFFSQTICPAAHVTVETDDETKESIINADIDYNKMLIEAVIEQDLAKVELSIKNKANIESRSAKGMSALAVACLLRNPEIVQLLLKHGAKINTAESEFNNLASDWIYEPIPTAMDLILDPSGRNNERRQRYIAKLNKLVLAKLEYHVFDFDLNVEGTYYDILKGNLDKVQNILIFFLKKSAEKELSKKCSKKAASCFKPLIENPPLKLILWSLLALAMRSSASSSHFETMKDEGGTIIAYLGTALFNGIYYGAIAKAITVLPIEFKKIIKSPDKPITLTSSELSIDDHINKQDIFGMTSQMWLIIRNKLDWLKVLSQACIENGIFQDPTTTNINHETPIMLAIKHKRAIMIPILKCDLSRHFSQLQGNTGFPRAVNNIIGQYLYGVSPDKIP